MVRAVTINDTPYSLERRGPLFMLRKLPAGPTYTGSVFPDWCSCPAFRFGKRPCKHLEAVWMAEEGITPEPVEYRDVPGYVGYRVGSDGSVWTRRTKGRVPGLSDTWRRMKTPNSSSGYRVIGFRSGAKNLDLRYVHRLVLEVFVGPCPDGREACHADGDKENNRLSNLRWDTPVANAADKESHGTVSRGERNGHAKLKPDQIPEILRLHSEGWQASHIATRYGVTAAAIRSIISGKNWKHIIIALGEYLVETATKEKVADAEFTATVAPTTHLPAVVALEPAAAPMPLGRSLAGVPRLAGALIKAQAKCRAVEKDARNTYHKYNYASAEAIIEEAKGPLNECGLALMPVGLHVNGHDREGENRFELEREFLLLHESGESVPIKCHWPICPDKGRPLDKATASADTTSLAYTLRDLLLMPRVGGDDDMSGRDDTSKPAAPVKPVAAKAGQAKPVKPIETEAATSPPEPCISPDDVAGLRRLVTEHKADEKALRARFKVKVLEDLRASQYQDAVKYLTGNLPLTDEQQQKIRATIDELKIGAKQVKDRLHDLYRVESLSQLKRVQASDLLHRLAASKAVKNAPAVAGAV